MQKPHDLGKSGEEIAANYLEKRGYVVLAKNYRYLKAEVDLIVQRENTIIGVEVKTRSARDFGNPQDFIKKANPKFSFGLRSFCPGHHWFY